MGDITKNFSNYEFRPKESPRSWSPDNKYQRILLRILVENLQIIRNEIPPGASMGVTSGVRSLSDFDRLTLSGYKPSKTSDHNFGSSIRLDCNNRKFKTFGSTYNFSIGACDIVPTRISAWDLFKLSFRIVKEGMCNFGQIIYERNPSKGWEWVHYGNDPSEFFSEEIVKMINRQKFMKSIDGGETYSIVSSI